jgi:hypothetical protein
LAPFRVAVPVGLPLKDVRAVREEESQSGVCVLRASCFVCASCFELCVRALCVCFVCVIINKTPPKQANKQSIKQSNNQTIKQTNRQK